MIRHTAYGVTFVCVVPVLVFVGLLGNQRNNIRQYEKWLNFELMQRYKIEDTIEDVEQQELILSELSNFDYTLNLVGDSGYGLHFLLKFSNGSEYECIVDDHDKHVFSCKPNPFVHSINAL